jgi:hypothetical protein
MNAEQLQKFLERLNSKTTYKAIRVYKNSFKIVGGTDKFKFIRWCHFPITNVEDTPEWRKYFGGGC